MKVFIMDNDKADAGSGVDLGYRAQESGHEVRYWTPPQDLCGNGVLEKPLEWEPSMDWADLIVLTGNSDYMEHLEDYFREGYPIFGTNAKSAELELDRAKGQKILEKHDIEVVPYHTVDDIDDAIELVAKTGKAYAIKPWGGEADKKMTCVARDADEAIYMLERWKEKSLKGALMLQERIEGVEVGISGFFGPAGWSAPLEESFEHKKFMNDDLGANTGEMGTVIRHVKRSKLFTDILEPLTDYLHDCKYVGDCNVNCIVDDRGRAWPLEFTMRLGWPDFCIRQALIMSDPVEWIADLLVGKDTLDIREDIAVGIVLSHGDFPVSLDKDVEWAGYPINGITQKLLPNLHFQEIMKSKVPELKDGEVEFVPRLTTAGVYIMVVTGTGSTVSEAADAAYQVAESITIPSNLMYRTDIGDRLEKELPKLHRFGYARGLNYE